MRRSEYAQHTALLQALEMYYRAARARLRVTGLTGARKPLARLVGRLKNRVGAGDASGADLARFQVELANHDDRLADAKTELAAAEIGLAGLVGVPNGRVSATDALKLPPVPRGPSALATKALAERSDLRAAAHEAEGGRALTRAAGRWWIPTLGLSVGYLSTDFGPGTGPGADVATGYTASVSATIPLFSRGGAEDKRGQAKMRRARAEQQVLSRDIGARVRAAHARLDSRVKRARAFEKRQLTQVRELVKKTESAYQGGEGTALELRDAYSQAANAELSYIELRYQSRIAELALRRAMGGKNALFGESK